jgi:hypothetical protein
MEFFKPIYTELWENNEVSKHIKVNYPHHYGRQRNKDK